jgi:7-carboxy-7-deazaguanine synthase
MKLYAISKIFYSVQSEGIHAGLPAVFIRFGRCNPQTRGEPAGFDWDGVVPLGDRMTANELAKLARICNFRCRWVVLTGSEPEAQLDSDLADALRGVGFYIAVETAGTAAPDHVAVDWLTNSPKPGQELRVKTADKVKYTVRYGDPIPSTSVPARNCILMPALDGGQFDKRNIEWCRELVKHNPPWQLSVQTGRIRTGKW